MININEFFSIVLNISLIVLVLFSIILVYKLIKTLIKLDKVVDDVNLKVNKLNGLFDIVDTATDTLSSISEKMVSLVSTGVLGFVNRFKRKGDKNE